MYIHTVSDGSRLALSVIQEGKQNLWVYDLRRETLNRLAGVSPNVGPSSFSANGKWLAFWPLEDQSPSLINREITDVDLLQALDFGSSLTEKSRLFSQRIAIAVFGQRLNLFTYRDLIKWLADPMETPPLVPAAEQLTLALV